MGAHDLQFRKAFSNPNMFKVACEVYLPEDINAPPHYTAIQY